jgi:hypothetical protein
MARMQPQPAPHYWLRLKAKFRGESTAQRGGG